MNAIILLSIAAVVAAATAVVVMKYLGNGNGHRAVFATEITEATEKLDAVSGIEHERSSPSVNSVSSVAENSAGVFSATSLRLRREIAALSRRGNLNLTIGVVTTGFALGLLAYMIFDESTTPDSFAAALSHYVPRITTVTLIEVFAFFFLNLYRASLIEIKFYQNELTSLASLQIALETSRDCPDPDATRLVLDQLSRRNPNASQAVSSELSAISMVPEDATLAALGAALARVAGLAAAGTKVR